jgi:hypothetical protein
VDNRKDVIAAPAFAGVIASPFIVIAAPAFAGVIASPFIVIAAPAFAGVIASPFIVIAGLTGLDPQSMNPNSWMPDQVRHDSQPGD